MKRTVMVNGIVSAVIFAMLFKKTTTVKTI